MRNMFFSKPSRGLQVMTEFSAHSLGEARVEDKKLGGERLLLEIPPDVKDVKFVFSSGKEVSISTDSDAMLLVAPTQKGLVTPPAESLSARWRDAESWLA